MTEQHRILEVDGLELWRVLRVDTFRTRPDGPTRAATGPGYELRAKDVRVPLPRTAAGLHALGAALASLDPDTERRGG